MDPHDPYFEHPYNGVGIARVSLPEPKPEQAERLAALYRGEIEYLDEQFGKLLAKLEEMGLYDDTLIALTADHGEEFHEHGGFWHGLTLYDEQIHVPAPDQVVAARRGRPPRAPTPASRARSTSPRRSSAPRASRRPNRCRASTCARPSPRAREKDRQVFAEEDHEGNVLWSLRTEDEKLIVANPNNPRGLPERAYYDVASDPGETDPFSEPDAEARLEEMARAPATRRRGQGRRGRGRGDDATRIANDCG